ncbi:hypothetical protein PFISCL1PPCAC_20217, partial [Pristionchus fissidentatus]
MENGTAVVPLNGGGASSLMMETPIVDEEMNGLDLSTKGTTAAAAAVAADTPLTLCTNGSGEGTPTPGTPINGSPEKGLEAGQISPSSLRRSTRASAIKAQQKIKDGDVPQSMEQENTEESEDESNGEEKKEPIDGESAAKKRKLENGKALDQFSHEFSIKMEDDGVYMLDEGSELSSLNETEIETLKKCYDKLLARELTDEQKQERTRMIKQAEADLRNEEAKLTMLKKMRASQIPKPNAASDLQRKLAASVAANAAGAAYKPPVAGSTAAAKNSAALAGNAAALAQLLGGGKGLTPQAQAQLLALLQSQAAPLLANMSPQHKEMMQRMGQYGSTQMLAALAMQQQRASGQQMSKEQQQILAAALLQQSTKAAAAAATTNSTAAAATASSAAAAAAAANSGTSTPTVSSSSAPIPTATVASTLASNGGASLAQRLSTARHAFRKTADTQLATQTVMPKACPNELFFLPNPNAPDFLSMLGLDQVVGRILKDKNATRPPSELPYECEECGCDFATGWKSIAGAKEEDLHLYCEACLRQAQKKKLRHDRTSQLKKIYAKVNLQEKEFERQISDGKLDGLLTAAVFGNAAIAARPTAAASPAVQNLSTKPSTPSVPSPIVQKPSTPSSSTPSGSKTTSSIGSTSSGTKRPATNTNNSQLQAQLAQLAQLTRANPMMAAMMGAGGGMMGGQAAAAAAAMGWNNPAFMQQIQQMQQLQARALQQQQQQQQQQQANNNAAAAKGKTA